MIDSDANWLIENLVHMVLATADADGKPWVSPVFFAHDQELNLYWVSDKKAKHSQNVRQRPEVAIVIFGKAPSGEIEALYIDAVAHQLKRPEELEKGILTFKKRQQSPKFTTNSAADVTGDACWRMYTAEPKAMSKRADGTDERTGQATTVRVPLS
jgi:uncharacterized protein YhbP (UPF0306 family)